MEEKMNRSKLLILIASLLFVGAFSAAAQTGPPIYNPTGDSSCLDVDPGNWTYSCFSGPGPGGGSSGGGCAAYAVSCANACSSQEATAYAHCSTLSDPV